MPAYVERTGASNPFDAVSAGDYIGLGFADVDGDGDLDAFVSSEQTQVPFLENTGTALAPSFLLVTGSGDPLTNSSTLPEYVAPSGFIWTAQIVP